MQKAGVLVAAVLVLSPRAASNDVQTEEIQNTRTALEKWVEVRRITSQEKRDWILGQEILRDRIELTAAQIENLRERRKEAEGSIGEAGKKLLELQAEQAELKASSATLLDTVVDFEAKVRGLIARLPEPARDRIVPLVGRLPKAGTETKLSLSDRYLNVVGIINELNKFNREVIVTSEVRKLDNGTSVEVAALYVGLGQGYYVSPNGRNAGVGTAGPSGWRWTAHNSAAGEIAKAIAILKDGAVAEFVQVPLQLEERVQ